MLPLLLVCIKKKYKEIDFGIEERDNCQSYLSLMQRITPRGCSQSVGQSVNLFTKQKNLQNHKFCPPKPD